MKYILSICFLLSFACINSILVVYLKGIIYIRNGIFMIKVALDAMGGDNAPGEIVKG